MYGTNAGIVVTYDADAQSDRLQSVQNRPRHSPQALTDLSINLLFLIFTRAT